MSREAALAALTGQPAPVVAAEPAPETAAPVVQEPAKDLESSRLAMFAKKEAQIVRDREEIKKLKAEWEEEKNKFKPLMEKGQRFEELIKSDAVEALRLMGMTDAQILNTFASVTQEKEPPSAEEVAKAAAQEEIKKFQDSEAAKKQEADAEKNKAVLKKFNENISQTVSSDKDKYEYCNFHGAEAEALIHDTIAKVLQESGGKDLMTIKEAAELVENYYEEKDKEMSTLKKRNPEKKDVQVAKTDARAAIEKINEQQRAAKTLTNKATATTASTIKKVETRSEKRERLENLLRNGLAK